MVFPGSVFSVSLLHFFLLFFPDFFLKREFHLPSFPPALSLVFVLHSGTAVIPRYTVTAGISFHMNRFFDDFLQFFFTLSQGTLLYHPMLHTTTRCVRRLQTRCNTLRAESHHKERTNAYISEEIAEVTKTLRLHKYAVLASTAKHKDENLLAPEVYAALKSRLRDLKLEGANAAMHWEQDVDLGQFSRSHPLGITVDQSVAPEDHYPGGAKGSVHAYHIKQAEAQGDALRDVNSDTIDYGTALATLTERGMDVKGLFDTPGCPCPYTVFLHLATKHKSGTLVLEDSHVGAILGRLADELALASKGGRTDLMDPKAELVHALSMKEVSDDSNIPFFYLSHAALLRVACAAGNLECACEVFEQLVAKASEADYGVLMQLAGKEGEHEFVLELFNEVRGKHKQKQLGDSTTTGLTHPALLSAAMKALSATGQEDAALVLAERHLKGPDMYRFRFGLHCQRGETTLATDLLTNSIAPMEGVSALRNVTYTLPLLKAHLRTSGVLEAVQYIEALMALETSKPPVAPSHFIALFDFIAEDVDLEGEGVAAVEVVLAMWGLVAELKAAGVKEFVESTEVVEKAAWAALRATEVPSLGGCTALRGLLQRLEMHLYGVRKSGDQYDVAINHLIQAYTQLPGEEGLHLAWLFVYGKECRPGAGALVVSRLHDAITDAVYCKLLLRASGVKDLHLRDAMVVFRSIRIANSTAIYALTEALQSTAECSTALRLLNEVYTKIERRVLGSCGDAIEGAPCLSLGQVAHSVRGLGKVGVLASMDVVRYGGEDVLRSCNKIFVPFALLARTLLADPASGSEEIRALLSLSHVEVIRVSEQVFANALCTADNVALDASLVTHRSLAYAHLLAKASQGMGVQVKVIAPWAEEKEGAPRSTALLAAEELSIHVERVKLVQ